MGSEWNWHLNMHKPLNMLAGAVFKVHCLAYVNSGTVTKTAISKMKCHPHSLGEKISLSFSDEGEKLKILVLPRP